MTLEMPEALALRGRERAFGSPADRREPARLAIFLRSLREGGGAEQNLLNLARGFAERGHAVDLVLGRREAACPDDLPAEIRCLELSGPRLAATARAAWRDPGTARGLLPACGRGTPPWVLACAPELADYLRTERPDALLSALSYSNLTALWARRLAGVATRIVVSERNTVSARAAHESRMRWRVLPSLLRRFYPEADAVSTVSDGVASDLARVTGIARDRIHTTYSAIVTPDLERRAAEPLAHPWLAEGAPPVVLGVGKLKLQKDFATLLRAFARLRRSRDARLVILGRGPERRRLVGLARQLGIARDVAFPGFVPNPLAFMARAGAFALSSAWEGLPSVLVQAMACGCPVASTDCPSGPREILAGGVHGPLVPVGDAEALAQALAGLLAQSPARGALRARAAAFDVAAAVDRTLPLLWPAVRDTSRRKVAS
jgi:glycosyltransferase involved in cell wall biosynthesis